jgi:hypothetical protein
MKWVSISIAISLFCAFLGAQIPKQHYLIWSSIIDKETENIPIKPDKILGVKLDSFRYEAVANKLSDYRIPYRYIKNAFPELDSNFIEAFRSSPAIDSLEEDMFHLTELKVKLVPRYGYEDWQDFYRKYPGSRGMVVFGKCYFEGDLALAYYHFGSASRSAIWAVYFLRRKDGVWEAINRTVFQIS